MRQSATNIEIASNQNIRIDYRSTPFFLMYRDGKPVVEKSDGSVVDLDFLKNHENPTEDRLMIGLEHELRNLMIETAACKIVAENGRVVGYFESEEDAAAELKQLEDTDKYADQYEDGFFRIEKI